MFEKLSPFSAVIIYFVLSVLWIFGSDYILLESITNPEIRSKIEVTKGLFFVGMTSAILYMILDMWHDGVLSAQARLQQAYEELKILEERLQMAFDASGEGIWEHDLITGKLFHSPTMYTMFGVEPDNGNQEMQWWNERIIAEDLDEITQLLEQCARGEVEQYERVFRIRPNGEKLFYIKTVGKIVRDDNGKPIKMYGTHTDITNLKEAEIELARLKDSLREKTTDKQEIFSN